MVESIDFGPGGVMVDGEQLGFPVAISALRRSLGRSVPRDDRSDADRSIVWDELGIGCSAHPKFVYVRRIRVFTRITGPGAGTKFIPAAPFTGQLTVSGVPIDQIEFLPGWQEGLLFHQVGPYLVRKVFDEPYGDRFELLPPDAGADYFTRKA